MAQARTGNQALRARWIGVGILCLAVLGGILLRARHVARTAPETASAPRPAPGAEFPEGIQATVPVRAGPSWKEMDDPARDGWDSEVFSAQAQGQLEALAKLALHPEEIGAERLEPLVTGDFSCGPLRPEVLKSVFQDQALAVERGVISPRPLEEGGRHRGAEGLAEALRALSGPFREAVEGRFQFKIVGVEPEGDLVVTRQRLEALSRTRESLREETASFRILWQGAGREIPPRMRSIVVEEFEVVRRPSPAPLFSDCTESVLGKNSSYREQLLHGLNHWLERTQDNRFFAILGTPGLAVGDVNGDGLDDLYLAQEGGLPNRLFLQSPDGSAADVSEASGANWLESTRGALLLDLDNDGHQDLAAAILGSLVLASGDGKGRFAIRALLPTSQDTMSLSAADFDRDGDLDLHVTTYKRDDLVEDSGVLSIDTSAEFFYHDANDGGRDILFRNDSTPPHSPAASDAASGRGPAGWRWSDVTEEVGLEVNNRRYGFASAWEDFDLDGDMDLYVANDFGQKNLYRNDSPGVPGSGPVRFVDIAPAASAEDRASGMSVSWGDYNRDGWMDIYVGNMFSAAGSRVTSQPAFKPQASQEVRAHLRRFARGNTLLENRGDGTFRDVSVEAGVTMGRWAWSSNFADLNNDGWEDLVVSNGYITTEDPGDL